MIQGLMPVRFWVLREEEEAEKVLYHCQTEETQESRREGRSRRRESGQLAKVRYLWHSENCAQG